MTLFTMPTRSSTTLPHDGFVGGCSLNSQSRLRLILSTMDAIQRAIARFGRIVNAPASTLHLI